MVVSFFVFVYILSLFNLPIVSLVAPLWRGENAVARVVANVTTFVHSKNSLIKENIELKEQLRFYEMEQINYEIWKQREAELLDLVGRNLELGGIVATVLSHPPRNPYDVLIIDVGTKDGVRLGSEIIMAEGPVLGVVAEIFGDTAKVRLFSTSGEKTNAVLERGGESIILEGRGSGLFKFTLPRNVPVESGDRILSRSIDSKLIAVVGNVSMKSTDSFKEVLAKSPANIFGLRFIIVKP